MAAQTFAGSFVAAVNCGLNGCVVGRFGTKTRGPGIARHQAVFLSHEQAVTPGQSKLLKPCQPGVHSLRLKVKGDRSVDDVVIVDFCEAREISESGGTNLYHGYFLPLCGSSRMAERDRYVHTILQTLSCPGETGGIRDKLQHPAATSIRSQRIRRDLN